MPVDEKVRRCFLEYESAKQLPTDCATLDALVRHAVGRLESEPEQAMRILQDVRPESSAKYLVGAINNPNAWASAQSLLIFYGESNATVKPLVAALSNPDCRDNAAYVLKRYPISQYTAKIFVAALSSETQRDAATDILLFFCASRVTVRPLIASMANEAIRPFSIGILISYGPSKTTVRPLLGAALCDQSQLRRDGACEVFRAYGRKALRYVDGHPYKNEAYAFLRNLLHSSGLREMAKV